MDDTPQHIKDKQLEIWLAKSPMERLKRTLQDNDDLHKLWDALRKSYNEKKQEASK